MSSSPEEEWFVRGSAHRVGLAAASSSLPLPHDDKTNRHSERGHRAGGAAAGDGSHTVGTGTAGDDNLANEGELVAAAADAAAAAGEKGLVAAEDSLADAAVTVSVSILADSVHAVMDVAAVQTSGAFRVGDGGTDDGCFSGTAERTVADGNTESDNVPW